ncbi:MAG: hypothetical protein Q8P22_11455 [Chloroflexota bacterium]|nr:hypothetical protein [Chloroflexota bacterium]
MSNGPSAPRVLWLAEEGPLPGKEARALIAMAALLQHKEPGQDFMENVYPVFLASPIAVALSESLHQIRQHGPGADIQQASVLFQAPLGLPEGGEGSGEFRKQANAFVARWVGPSEPGRRAIGSLCALIAHRELSTELQSVLQQDQVVRALLLGAREAKPTTQAGRHRVHSLWQALSQPEYERSSADALQSNAQTWATVVVKYHNLPAAALRGEFKSWQQATLSRALRPFDVALGLPRKRERRPRDRQV